MYGHAGLVLPFPFITSSLFRFAFLLIVVMLLFLVALFFFFVSSFRRLHLTFLCCLSRVCSVSFWGLVCPHLGLLIVATPTTCAFDRRNDHRRPGTHFFYLSFPFSSLLLSIVLGCRLIKSWGASLQNLDSLSFLVLLIYLVPAECWWAYVVVMAGLSVCLGMGFGARGACCFAFFSFWILSRSFAFSRPFLANGFSVQRSCPAFNFFFVK